jgi:hypothetical protein
MSATEISTMTGSTTNQLPDPAKILDIGMGFWSSKVLLTAVELNVFTVLADRAMTGEELAAALTIHPRGIYDFFDSLVALGFLMREGNGVNGYYPRSNHWQKRRSPKRDYLIELKW